MQVLAVDPKPIPKPEFVEELLEPGCMAGLVSHPGIPGENRPLLLHSSPHTVKRDHRERKDVSIHLSRDDGATWTPLSPIGNFGGIVAMASLVRLADGRYMALFHDDGRLSELEDASPAAMRAYREAFGETFAFEALRSDAALARRWATLRTDALLDLSTEITAAVREYRPTAKTVRNLFAPVVLDDLHRAPCAQRVRRTTWSSWRGLKGLTR